MGTLEIPVLEIKLSWGNSARPVQIYVKKKKKSQQVHFFNCEYQHDLMHFFLLFGHRVSNFTILPCLMTLESIKKKGYKGFCHSDAIEEPFMVPQF